MCAIASVRQRNSSRRFARRTSGTHFVKASTSAHSGASGGRRNSSSIQPLKYGDSNGGGAGNRRETRHSMSPASSASRAPPSAVRAWRSRSHSSVVQEDSKHASGGSGAGMPRSARCAAAALRSASCESIQVLSTARASGWSPRSMASRMGRRSLWWGARLASRNPSSWRWRTRVFSCLRTPVAAARCCRARVTTFRLNSTLSNRKISSDDRDSRSGVASAVTMFTPCLRRARQLRIRAQRASRPQRPAVARHGI